MQAQQGKNKLFSIPLYSAVLFMLSKLILVPLLMVGLAKANNLNDEAGRAAVLIASFTNFHGVLLFSKSLQDRRIRPRSECRPGYGLGTSYRDYLEVGDGRA